MSDCRTCRNWHPLREGDEWGCTWGASVDTPQEVEVSAWVDQVRERCGFDPRTHLPMVEQHGPDGCPQWEAPDADG